MLGAPRGPPPPPRPEVCELRSSTAQSQRGPQKSLSSPPAAPPVPRAESSGAAAFRPCSDWGRGRRAWDAGGGRGRWARGGWRAEGEVSGPRPLAAALRPPWPRIPTPCGRAAPCSAGDQCPRRSAPAPGPARDSLRNSIPPPPARRPRRPSHSICRSALDSASRRSAPARPPPPSLSRVRGVLPS